MRVALLAPLFESVPPRLYGGTERVVDQLCRGLKDAGHEVTLFASGDSTVDVPTIRVIDQALRLRNPPPNDPNICHFQMLADVLRHAKEFDVIHNHHDYYMLPLSELTEVPVLTTVHGRLDLPEVGPVYRAFPHSSFVSISDSQRSPLPDLNWVRTIYHGLQLQNFSYHPDHGQYLAFLGRISREKHPEWAIRIAKEAGVSLKIAAKIEGRASQDYFDEILAPEIDGNFIQYVGEIHEEQKSDFLGNARALLFPIDWPEPFGLVMIEALACGTPVLARPCGSVPEILADGITGFLSNDLSELASRVHDIPSISRKRCREWAEQRFSVDRMTEEYIHVYRYLTGLSRRPPSKIERRRTGTRHHRRNLLYPFRRAAHGNS